MSRIKKIIVIRNDKLGDFMLAFPSFVALKNTLPDSEIHALVPKYTADVAALCKGIDKIIIDPGPGASKRDFLTLVSRLRSEKYDASITLFSTTRVGLALLLARVPYRLAPATKLAQVFHNHRLTQRRSHSTKPEYEYNLDLIRHFCRANGISMNEQIPPYLQFDDAEIHGVKDAFCAKYFVDAKRKFVFVHPGSGGSANNLSLNQYANLAAKLCENKNINLVVSAGPTEMDTAQKLAKELDEHRERVVVFESSNGLVNFAKHLAFADLFISGSTGPLHIAAALNRNTTAFYPRSRVNSSLRWQTVNDENHRLAFSPPDSADEDDMSSIDINLCVEEIVKRFI